MNLSPEERFSAKVMPVTETGCWLWLGRVDWNGYGKFHAGGKELRAHRWSYEHFKEPIPKGLTLDHKCRVRCCVNPDHLRVMTLLDNVMCGESFGAVNARKTHCIRGHEFNLENTLIVKDKPYRKRGRVCRECRRIRERRRIYGRKV